MSANDLVSICPHCGKVNTLTTGLSGATIPKPGDVSVCIGCFGTALWTTLMGLRKPTDAEHAEIEAHPTIRKLRAHLAARGTVT